MPLKSIPRTTREIYFFLKAAKYIQREIHILLISTIQEMIQGTTVERAAFKAESKPSPALERRR